jgi:hypothetical protein
MVNRFSDYLHIVTTINYNTITISILYSSVEHTIQRFQSATRRFLVTAPTMTIPLSPGSSSLFTDSRTELTWSPQLSYL